MGNEIVDGLRLISGRELLSILFEKMKRRSSISCGCLLFALVLLNGLAFQAAAQDRLVLKDGKVQEGRILGINGAAVQVGVGGGSIAIPLASVASMTMAAPAELAQAIAATQAGDPARALPAAKAVAEKYKGLPVDWARKAASLVGDLHVALGDFQQAQADYAEYARVYPATGAAQSALGAARIALARKNLQDARQNLEPLAAAALAQKTPPVELAPIYSQTFLLRGEIAEAQNQPEFALENYLRTVTLFPEDPGAAAAAQAKADALRKKDPTLTVP